MHEAARRAAGVPWDVLRDVAEGMPEQLDGYETFEITMTYQMRWLAEADGGGHGVIALVFQ